MGDSSISFVPGRTAWLLSESSLQPFVCVFEDDGETGYFYGAASTDQHQILDAMHIYNASAVADRDRESVAAIVWSPSGLQAALLLNGYPHAAIDFAARRGYCRTDFPNTPSSTGWSHTHAWDDAALEFFVISET